MQMRRIETEAGTIVGNVDRTIRRVRWHLECPECQSLVAFTDATFQGHGPLACECGWNSRPIGHKERSEDGSVYIYHDYSALLERESSGGSTEPGRIHSGMGF